MAILKNYQEFAGRHWETGTVRNALAYLGVKSPHTNQPISEALLMGLSGGAAFGYFIFEYEGYLPHLILLTRNSFNPFDTMLERLAVPQDVMQTNNPRKAEANLLEALESGSPALVWADMFSLPYYDLPYDEQNWGMMPMVVYGYENGTAYIADRSNRPFTVSIDDLNKARGRVKQEEYRVVTLDAPDWSRLPAAVSQSIAQCIRLFVETPPKGKRENFGLAALQHWASMLTNTRNKLSWTRYFAPGERLWMALAGDATQPGGYSWLKHEAGNSAERGMYADFLNEAALILDKPSLNAAADQFRASEAAWTALADMMLPDSAPAFKEAKTLLDRKFALYTEQGSDGLDEIRKVNSRLREMLKEVDESFPLADSQLIDFRAGLAAQVLKVHDLEREAVECLQAAMA